MIKNKERFLSKKKNQRHAGVIIGRNIAIANAY